jgi:hypothetical protein
MTPANDCAMSATAVIKTRFPADSVARLDQIARDTGAKLGRKIARAAVLRAIVHLLADKLDLVDVPGLAELFGLDRVRRGRAPGPSKARRA